jgi:hypothetical protein
VTSFTDVPSGPDRTIVYRVYAVNSELTSVPSKPASIELSEGITENREPNRNIKEVKK